MSLCKFSLKWYQFSQIVDFIKLIIYNKSRWWEYDNDGIPDCYESTDSENPENEYVLSNGKTTFSLINEPHSDKQTSGDTIYDVVTIEENDRIYYTDGIVDGEEIVFSNGNPELNEKTDEGYVIAISQALTDLIENNIIMEANNETES